MRVIYHHTWTENSSGAPSGARRTQDYTSTIKAKLHQQTFPGLNTLKIVLEDPQDTSINSISFTEFYILKKKKRKNDYETIKYKNAFTFVTRHKI